MKHLKTYKIFESSNASFDWLRKQNNERYIDLMYILQSDIFDEFKILSKTHETFDDDGNTVYPEHKFWVFRMKESANADVDTSNPDEIGDKTVDCIIVFNIKQDEKDRFWNEVLELREKIEDLIGKQLVIIEEIIDDGYNYDYIIKLSNETYKLFESADYRQTIKDIFLELEDIGFLIEIFDKLKIGKSKSDPGLSTYGQFYPKNSGLNLKNKIKKDFICVKIIKHWPNTKFEWNEVEDYIKRLIDFLENTETTYKYYQINIYEWKKSGTFPLKELTDTVCDSFRKEYQGIEEVQIYFEKNETFEISKPIHKS